MNFKRQLNKPYVPAHILGIRQEGGEVMMGEPDMGEPVADPMEELVMGAQQAVESGDGQLALQVCAMIVELAMGGAQEEQPPMEEEMPMEGEMMSEEPMM